MHESFERAASGIAWLLYPPEPKPELFVHFLAVPKMRKIGSHYNVIERPRCEKVPMRRIGVRVDASEIRYADDRPPARLQDAMDFFHCPDDIIDMFKDVIEKYQIE